MKPDEHFVFLTEAEWTLLNPVVPANVFAVSTDNGRTRLGDGSTTWSGLSTASSLTIGNKLIQSDRDPNNNEMAIFCSAEDKWIFRLVGCFLTVTECITLATVYPKFTFIIEVDDISGIPTGRFKMGDGTNGFDDLPWFGQDFSTIDYSIGEAPVFDGTNLSPTIVMTNDILQAAASPLGKFHRDDGTWAFFEDCEFDIGKFETVIIGVGPLEADTISLTTVNGIDLLVDGIKVWTQGNDGTDSGLDADLLDGHQSSYFSIWNHTHPIDSFVEGDIVVADSSGLAANSGTSLADIDEDALVYAIAMGG
jgi:hypothetical protein